MRIKLNQLQKIVKEAMDEDRSFDSLRSEVSRVLGSSVITTGKISEVVAAANDRVDYIELTGKGLVEDFSPRVLIPFMESKNAGLRRLVAKTLPIALAKKLAFDNNPSVRYAVASRLSASQVKRVMQRFPMDENLSVIYKGKLLNEDGVTVRQPDFEPFDLYGKKRMGDIFRDAEPEDEGMSDAFYLQTAMTMMQDYGQMIDEGWEEIAVRRYVSSVRSVSGTNVDATKLLEKIRELRTTKEDVALKRCGLKESRIVKKFSIKESMDSYFVNAADEVRTLLESKTNNGEFIKKFETLLQVKHSRIPAGIRMHCLGEGNAHEASIPVVGQLPHDEGFRSIDEKALDTYCEAWSAKQRLSGEPLKIEWATHPDKVGKVSFHVSLR